MLEQVRDLYATEWTAQLREAEGKKVRPRFNHLIFTGPSGTGKTTTAESIADLYSALGVTTKPVGKNMIKATPTDLRGSHLGQSAPKVRELFARGKGGVIFIDEAYGIVSPGHEGWRDELGHEAVVELLTQLEKHRDDTVVILAGYGPEMHEFLKTNPGLRSRLPKEIHLPAFTPEQSMDIIDRMNRDMGHTAAPKVKAAMREAVVTSGAVGNAREIDNLFNEIITAQARRIVSTTPAGKSPSPRKLDQITETDIEAGLSRYVLTRSGG